MRETDRVRQGLGVDGKTMVMAGNLNGAAAGDLDRLVSPPVTEFELVGFCSQRQAHDLVAETDAEHRLLSQKRLDIIDSIGAGGRITWPV